MAHTDWRTSRKSLQIRMLVNVSKTVSSGLGVRRGFKSLPSAEAATGAGTGSSGTSSVPPWAPTGHRSLPNRAASSRATAKASADFGDLRTGNGGHGDIAAIPLPAEARLRRAVSTARARAIGHQRWLGLEPHSSSDVAGVSLGTS